MGVKTLLERSISPYNLRTEGEKTYDKRNPTNKSCLPSEDTSLKQLANCFISPCEGMNVVCSDFRK